MTSRTHIMKIQKISLILTLIFFCQWAQAQPHNHKSLQTQIEKTKSTLSHTKTNQSTVQENLRTTEIKMGKTSLTLHKIQQALETQQKQLQQLNLQQANYQAQLTSLQATLAKQLRAIYMTGQQSYLQILLNQENPNQVSRMLTYYHYLNGPRLKLIEQYNQTLTALNQTEKQITDQTQRLSAFKQQQQIQNKQFANQQQQREQLLETLGREIQSKQQQLNYLLINEKGLNQIVTHLQKTNSTNIQNKIPAHHKGKFIWPTAGNITQHYDAPIDNSQLKTTGVVIKAPAGQSIYAIAPGTVVFANWMAGYGLLLIIDHGNGWMSIYGRNRTLFKKVGDKVQIGSLIATVGNSGGYKSSGLYFALRHNGQPANPQKWCG